MTERHALPEIGWARAMRKYELRRRIEVLVFGAHAGQPVLRAQVDERRDCRSHT